MVRACAPRAVTDFPELLAFRVAGQVGGLAGLNPASVSTVIFIF
jgi:hypothetical protein